MFGGTRKISTVTVHRAVVVGEPGSAGVFKTEFVDLPDPLPLDSGLQV